MKEHGIWVEKYRPQKVKDLILELSLKKKFEHFVKSGEIPHLLLYGDSGMGKTSALLSIVKELDLDYMFINTRKDGTIEKIRNDVSTFAETVSLKDGIKAVILDEVDGIASQGTWNALKPLLEANSSNCIYLMTSNNVGNIDDAVKSRVQDIHFKIKDKNEYAKAIMLKCKEILENEGVAYNANVIKQIIKKQFPDIRKIIGTLQNYQNELENLDIIKTINSGVINNIFEAMKSKDIAKLRKLVIHDVESSADIYTKVYKEAQNRLKGVDFVKFLHITNDYMCSHGQAIDKEIHILSFLVKIAGECKL